MKPSDILLAIGVAVTWGLGFVASRLALNELSPALMTAMRFGIAALPCLFLRRPNVPTVKSYPTVPQINSNPSVATAIPIICARVGIS